MPKDKENTSPDKGKKKKLPKKLSERYLRNAGEFYLNRFTASSAHFRTVMIRKIDRSCRAHATQAREEWTAWLDDTLIPAFHSSGFLNDDLYAKGLYTSLKNRALSSKAILARMTQKGVDKNTVLALLHDEEDGLDEKQAVTLFAQKKRIGRYAATPSASDPGQRRRDLGRLARAGFSYDVAMTVFD